MKSLKRIVGYDIDISNVNIEKLSDLTCLLRVDESTNLLISDPSMEPYLNGRVTLIL